MVHAYGRHTERNVLFQFTLIVLLFSLLALALAALPTAAGQTAMGVLTTEVTPVTDTILRNGVAEYTLTITNPLPVEQRVRLSFEGDIEWIFRTDPLYHGLTGITVPAHSTSTTHILLSLRQQDITARQYILGLALTSETSGLSARHDLVVNLRSGTAGFYKPAVSVSADFPAEADPREVQQLRLSLRNRNPLDIKELTIITEGALATAETTTTLGPNEEKTVVQDILFDSTVPPQNDILTVKLFVGDEPAGQTEAPYRVKAYADIVETISEEKGFLRERLTFAYLNDGNVQGEATVRKPLSLWRVPFTKTTPKGKLGRSGGGWALSWDVRLAPQARTVIHWSQDFRLVSAVLLIIAVVLSAYFLLRSPVVLRKEAVVAKRLEGGISEVKVVLHVRNRSTGRVDDVLITDSVPEIIEVSHEFGLGTLRPDKMLKHPKLGNILRWHIDYLEPLEERIITYRVRAKLSILGSITLPQYVTKFKVGNKERITTSNRFTLEMPELAK